MTSWAGLEVVAAQPLLAGTDPGQIDALTRLLEPVVATPGQVLGREGEPGHRFWLVVDGELEVTVRTAAGTRRLATVGPGAIVGELALLRRQPRTATITAMRPSRLLAGDEEAMDRILAGPEVRARVDRLASARLAQDAHPVHARLADGSEIIIRPLLPSDRNGLDSALHSLSSQSLRRRFFSAGAPSDALVDYLIDIDFVDHFAWIAFDGRTHSGMAVARYIRRTGDPAAEMAFTTLDSFQGRGVGTFLLGALGVAAQVAGVDTLVAHVLEDNRAMRKVFAKAGGRSRYDEPGVVVVTVDPSRAAALIDHPTASAIAASVGDVVTAASLALTQPPEPPAPVPPR
ncbi:MAG TPA: GNAT family N-acetyltransferase [Acidimicrobiales bacterium]|jgi:CRP-like cAMP-binding protein|nr:GNAT family N-acetyltransferase [Acidimicrobiales bacterium]